ARRLAPMVERFDLVHTMAASALLPFRRLRSATPWVHTEHLSGILAPVAGDDGVGSQVVTMRTRTARPYQRHPAIRGPRARIT
ncbi:MAG: hypothetical protein J0I66_08785, partial [Microbacterium sp.]|nr:hypothetical protein [Microbacterium sp.]